MFYAAKHLIMDFLSAIVFIAIYGATDNLPLAVAATIAVAAGQVGLAAWRKQRLDPMVWLSLVLALAFGTAALFSRDPRFVMAKPSVIHLAVAIAMLRRGWMLRYMDERSRAYVPERVVIASGYGWAFFMIALAAANLISALTLPFATWAWFVSTGLVAAKMGAVGVQYVVFRVSATRRAKSQTVLNVTT